MDKPKRDKQGITVKALPIGSHGATVLGIDPMETVDSVLNAKPHKLNQMANIINQQVLGKSKRPSVMMDEQGVIDIEQGVTNGAKIHLPDKPKRGKDIKTFADLPPDMQQTIDSLSMVDGKICQRVKVNRTAIAINYQHLFPDRYHSTGVAV